MSSSQSSFQSSKSSSGSIKQSKIVYSHWTNPKQSIKSKNDSTFRATNYTESPNKSNIEVSARYLLEDGIAGVNVRPEFVIKGTINGQPMFVINNPYSTYHNQDFTQHFSPILPITRRPVSASQKLSKQKYKPVVTSPFQYAFRGKKVNEMYNNGKWFHPNHKYYLSPNSFQKIFTQNSGARTRRVFMAPKPF